MEVFLNGQFVPEAEAMVSVFDRSFLYGDGLFETMRIFNGKPFRWQQHVQRLRAGARFLNIQLPHDDRELGGFVQELISRNHSPEALLRLTLSRGVGVRGYSPRGATNPFLVMSLHAAPALDLEKAPQWKFVTASVRLPANQPVAHYKTCNKIVQILARAEADEAGADEALLQNTDGALVEGASSNLFWMEENFVCTPPLITGILPGVTRAVVLELCQKLGRPTREASTTSDQIRQAEGIFISLSTVGLAEGVTLDGVSVRQAEFLKELWKAYWDLVQNETK